MKVYAVTFTDYASIAHTDYIQASGFTEAINLVLGCEEGCSLLYAEELPEAKAERYFPKRKPEPVARGPQTLDELVSLYRARPTSEILHDEESMEATGFWYLSYKPDSELDAICEKPAPKGSAVSWKHVIMPEYHVYYFYCPTDWVSYPYGFKGYEILEGYDSYAGEYEEYLYGVH